MQEFSFVTNYKNNEVLRKSFFELAKSTFDISFEDWYEQGFWGEGYIPFSFVEGDKVIANASVNVLELVINGEKKKAIQIGTVMTHPDYQKRGLSAYLMNKVIEEFENQVDFMYLFANETVLEFYPKFGFEAVEEHIFSINFPLDSTKNFKNITNLTPNPHEQTGIRKLDVSQPEDLRLITKFASQRLPVSQRFGTNNTKGILMYYCLNVFCDHIYYLENEDVIAIFSKENNHMDIFDIISINEMNENTIQHILALIGGNDTVKATFHFTPDYKGIELKSQIINDGLFVRATGDNVYPAKVKHPVTSIA
ncbi:GNAT superfamily N-acetyltransferase [Paenibacillus turicensis]|uniref:GNAT superfamily N-acetyltransferase n=1 Tax=Paenibacillus turicensis TaxID=160487 RepID=A0ABS4FMQ0_9BACL|nr:GNAT superfamily N-acetyltransferase [Paenibacillus turicensis]